MGKKRPADDCISKPRSVTAKELMRLIATSMFILNGGTIEERAKYGSQCNRESSMPGTWAGQWVEFLDSRSNPRSRMRLFFVIA